MGKKGAKRKTRWRTLSIGTPPGEEDEEDGSQRNGYVKSEQRSPTHYNNRDSSQRNGYHHHQHHNNHQQAAGVNHHNSAHQHQQQPWLKSRHGSAGSSSNGGSSSGYASGESRNVAFNEDEYTKITTPRQDMLFKKGYLTQRKQQVYASTSATPSTTESQSASHSTADGSEAAEDQQLLDSGAPTDYLSTAAAAGTATVLEAAPAQLSYGTYYDHASGYYYEYPMMLVGPALPPDQMHHVPCAAMQCAPVPLRPIEWVNPAFVPKLASQQYCYMDYQAAQGPDCAALVDAQGMPLTNGLSNETSLTGSASVSASGSVVDDIDESPVPPLTIADQEMTELVQQQQIPAPAAVMPLEVVDQAEVVTLPMEYAPVEAAPYVEPQPMPYLYPGQYMFGPPVVNVNGVTIQSGPMLRCSDMLASSAAAAAAAAAKRRKKKKKKKQKRPHALGNTEDEDEEDYSSEGDTALSSPSRVPWPPTESTATMMTTTTTTTSWPLNPECQEFHLPEANASMESSELPPQPEQQQQQQQQLSNEVKRLSNDEEDEKDKEEEVTLEEESIKPKTRRRSLKIVREPTPGPDLGDVSTEDRHDEDEEDEVEQVEEDHDDRPIEQVSAMLATASIIETPRKDGDVDASGWQNESSITSESFCAASRTADETDSGFESQSTTTTAAVAATSIAASAEAAAAAATEISVTEAVGKSRHPITDAVNEWLKRANSPDLFITSSATSDDDEVEHQQENEEDEDDGNDQPKNLQGNPMPALSVNGQASHGQLASSNAQSCKQHRKKRTQRRKRDQAEQCGKQDLTRETLIHSVRAPDDPPGVAASELTVKDSDAGMRVAEKTRIIHEDTTASAQPVKTYEKGEIVVSMDGELLLVETVTTRIDNYSSSSSLNSSSVSSVMEASLGSIEEPDLVVECWEPETVEPVATPKKIIDDDSISLLATEGKRESMGHVQRYYRLIEDQVEQPATKKAVISSSDESSDEDEVDRIVEVAVPVITPDKCISYDPRLPVDEAFEVYESCYNATNTKSLPYEHRPPFYQANPTEGPIPCKANCCNIQ